MQRNILTALFGCLLFLMIGFISRASTTEGSTAQNSCRAGHCQLLNQQSPLGTNLAPAKDWSSEYPFVDAFKLSRPWITHDFADGVWDTREADLLDTDTNGWVRSLPRSDAEANFRTIGTLLFTRLAQQYPEGEYTVLYNGQGTISYGRDARKDYAKSSPGRDVIVVSHGAAHLEGGIYLQIEATDPLGTGDYIRDIRVLMPGFTEADLDNGAFHPSFVDSIARYKVLRFMDWMQTNYEWNSLARRRTPRQPLAESVHPLEQDEYNPLLNQSDWDEYTLWNERSREMDARYSTDNGVPLEVMIDLSNRVSADPWFNMPHHATNFYIWSFAKTAHEQLADNRVVFVEYSNEVWNSSFGQSQWVEQQGQAKWPESGFDQYRLRYIWYGMRSAEMCQIWKDTWGADANRVKCVLNTQATNRFVADTMLDCELYAHAPCDRFHDAVAIAPYFGQHIGQSAYEPIVSQWAANPTDGLDKLFAELEHGNQLETESYIFKATLPNIYDQMRVYRELANERGLDYVAYEGGQHLVGVGSTQWNGPIAALFAAANRDPRMAALYETYLDEWHAAGGQIFAHYSSTGIYSAYGNWGAQEFYNQTATVKVETIHTHIEETACVWDICSDRTVFYSFLPTILTPPDEAP